MQSKRSPLWSMMTYACLLSLALLLTACATRPAPTPVTIPLTGTLRTPTALPANPAGPIPPPNVVREGDQIQVDTAARDQWWARQLITERGAAVEAIKRGDGLVRVIDRHNELVSEPTRPRSWFRRLINRD